MTLPILIAQALTRATGDSAPEPPEFAAITEEPGLPRVLLIGDSISIGYTLPVRALLQGKANLHRIPENGGPTIRALERLEAWLGAGRWDVIHFNFGLHDLKRMPEGPHQVPLPEYAANLRWIVERLRATGAALIWASTTPVPEGDVSPRRSDADVQAYNAAAREIMAESSIPINDLYAAVLPELAALQRPVNVHFTEDGSAALGRVVAARIGAALAARG